MVELQGRGGRALSGIVKSRKRYPAHSGEEGRIGPGVSRSAETGSPATRAVLAECLQESSNYTCAACKPFDAYLDSADVVEVPQQREEAAPLLVVPHLDFVVVAARHKEGLGGVKVDAAHRACAARAGVHSEASTGSSTSCALACNQVLRYATASEEHGGSVCSCHHRAHQSGR